MYPKGSLQGTLILPALRNSSAGKFSQAILYPPPRKMKSLKTEVLEKQAEGYDRQER